MVNVLNDMAKLAIKGHPTRGKEVIEILKMLGGVNHSVILDTHENLLYSIRDSDNYIIGTYPSNTFVVFTLEEFLEKFPYKVGDKLKTIYGKVGVVKQLIWSYRENRVLYELEDDVDSLYHVATELQPYKEETMEEKGILTIDFTKDTRIADEVEVILGDYEFVLKDGKTYFVKKQPKYPKTYEECCKVLGINELPYMVYTWNRNEEVILQEYQISTIEKLDRFRKLLVCRDAYWKIAGEEMGLEKPWEPDFDNENEYKYGLFRLRNSIYKDATCINPTLLIFPTKEMRDAFYNNFKDLIESCKELL